MPTLFSALKARHGQLPRAPRAPLVSRREAEFAPFLLSERVAGVRRKAISGADVIVVGAGLAGLAAAYELQHVGYNVTVLESQNRLGGRVKSLDDIVPGKVVEGGGELIGTNHPTWNAYAARFGLTFSDVVDEPNAPIVLLGRRLDRKQSNKLLKEMEDVLGRLTQLASTLQDPFAPWITANAKTLDNRTLEEWIDGADSSSLCKLAVKVMMSTDNGVPAHRQSLLGNLAMIQGGGGERYWVDTERYRCREGNQRLAEKLAEPLGNRISFKANVSEIQVREDDIEVSIRGAKPIVARHAILAIPPSLWRSIRFSPPLPRRLQLQMGKNVKCLMSFRTEFWQQTRLSPNLTTDGPIGLTWHSTQAQHGSGHAIVGFSGAQQADNCIKWKPTQRIARYIAELRRVYGSIEGGLVDARFMNWPSDPWVKASYAFPAPGEITKWGPLLRDGIGNLHFAGEHTCYAFMGYMEGALASGVIVAARLAKKDKLA